ncbi:hypothetical protein BGX28_002530 [Mortierella sp. GBA30]|nr:hypothetical protein BGX28_002530 [Mortierella sp. GBA30]
MLAEQLARFSHKDSIDDGKTFWEKMMPVFINNIHLARRFNPLVYSGDILFFRASVPVEENAPLLEPASWKRYARGKIEAHDVECSHFEMDKPENIALIARLPSQDGVWKTCSCIVIPKPLTKRQQEAKAKREVKKKEWEAKKLAAKREPEASQAAGSQRKTKRRKLNPRQMKYSKSGKGARSAKHGLIDIESKKPKAMRTVVLVTRQKKRLERAHGIVSLDTWSIHGVLVKNLHAFHKVQRQNHSLPTEATQYDIALLANSIQFTMNGIVDYLNTTRQWIHLVLDLLIAYTHGAASQRTCQNLVSRIGTLLRMSWDELTREQEEAERREADAQAADTESNSDAESSGDTQSDEGMESAVDTESNSDAESSGDTQSDASMESAAGTESDNDTESGKETESGNDTESDERRRVRPESRGRDRLESRSTIDPKLRLCERVAAEIDQFYTRLEFEMVLKITMNVNEFFQRHGLQQREQHSDRRDKIALWFRRNLLLPKGECWKFYPQIEFTDSFRPFSELALRDILWAPSGTTRPQMLRFFGTKDQAADLKFNLFVDRTNHTRRTMSLHEYIRLQRIPA